MRQVVSEEVAQESRPLSVESALRTVRTEIEAIVALEDALKTLRFGEALDLAIQTIAKISGRVIVTGMGKSGHIGRKIAATLRSTGTSAIYLHPGEASHGDLGLISPQDVVFAITWSGETKELIDVFQYCRHIDVPLIVATSKADSTAARAATICLALPVVPEACPNDLAPTSSTTLQLVLGDALAVALIEARGFSPLNFHTFHPGGRLGALLLAVDRMKFDFKHSDVMDFSLPMCLKIGFCQCLAMVPGVSRSGATIVGAMFMGADKRAAAEFSFWLAMPTMAGAFAYDLFKNYKLLEVNDVVTISIGFVAAFFAALVVVRGFLAFVSRRGFTLFAYWRIIVGSLGFIGLLLTA